MDKAQGYICVPEEWRIRPPRSPEDYPEAFSGVWNVLSVLGGFTIAIRLGRQVLFALGHK